MKLLITIIIGLVFTADPAGKEGVKEGMLGMSMPAPSTNVGMGFPNNQFPSGTSPQMFPLPPNPNNQFPNNQIGFPNPINNSPVYQIQAPYINQLQPLYNLQPNIAYHPSNIISQAGVLIQEIANPQSQLSVYYFAFYQIDPRIQMLRAPATKCILIIGVNLNGVNKFAAYRVNVDNFQNQTTFNFEDIVVGTNLNQIMWQFGVQ